MALDFIVILLLVSPIYGCFYPLESYLSLPSKVGAEGYSALPFPATTVSLVIIMALAVFYAWMTMRVMRLRHDFFAYLLIAIAFASAIWAYDSMLALQRAARLMPLVIFAVILPQFYGLQKMMRLVTVAFAVAVLLSIIICIINPGLGIGRIGGAYDFAWRGAFIQKNLTGIMFAIGVVLCYGAWRVQAVSTMMAIATGVGCLFMVVMSQSGTSAGSLVQAVVAIAMMTLVQKAKSEARILLLIGIVLFAVMSIVMFFAAYDLIFSLAGRDATLTGRTEVWDAVWKSLQIHPFRGYGYGFWVADSPARNSIWRQVGYAVGHSHNSWLDMWLQLGLGGLILLIVIVALSFGRAMKLVLTTEEPIGPVLVGLAFLLFGRSMTEVQYTDPFPSILFFPMWASMIAAILLQSSDNKVGRLATTTTRSGIVHAS